MKTLIGNKTIKIGENVLEYYSYYFDVWVWHTDKDFRLVVKSVVAQFAALLKELGQTYSALYLPYIPDDQGSWCLKATFQAGKIVLTAAEIKADGYAMNFDDMKELMTSEPEVYEEKKEAFGVYDRNALIESLLNAEIINEG